MRNALTAFVTAVVCTCLVACEKDGATAGGTSPVANAPPPPPAATPDPATTPSEPPVVARPAADDKSAVFEAAFAIVEQMADLWVRDQDDCEKLAADLTAFFAANVAGIEKMKALDRVMSREDKRAAEQQYGDRIKAIEAKVKDARSKCDKNPSVRKAMRSLD